MSDSDNQMDTHSLTTKNAGKKEVFLIILLILIGVASRFHTFDRKSLWLDEIYTFNDSRDDFKGQIKFYKENPSFHHPPLFFILTHLFHPFTEPERDLRIVPLIFGVLSIIMMYFLSKSFSTRIALLCTLSLVFMTYHIYVSQDGRSYSLLMFLGMTGLYFFIKHLNTSDKRYLWGVALSFALSFLTSYSSISFIVLSQTLWFYRPSEEPKKPNLSSFLILNSLILLFCLPWILFVVFHYKGQAIMDPFHTEDPGSIGDILYGVLHDWVPFAPLMSVCVISLILFPFFSRNKRNALILLSVLIGPIVGILLFCRLFNITHFVASRYFINFLPLFLITLFLSLDAIENRFSGLRRLLRLKILFAILFIASNLVLLPLYYRLEKQDFRGLSVYLKDHLVEGDRLFDWNGMITPGLLHYFGVLPEGRHYAVTFSNVPGKGIELRKSFNYQNKTFTIHYSTTCCKQYVNDGRRLWIIVVGNSNAKKFQDDFHIAVKAHFDGSFFSASRFPTDASLYVFLLDP